MDYYLRTSLKQAFIEDLQRVGIQVELQDNYYQDQTIIIDWIGLVPLPVELDESDLQLFRDEDYPVEPTGAQYYEGQHVNIRSVNLIDITLFANTVDVHPVTPFRMFS